MYLLQMQKLLVRLESLPSTVQLLIAQRQRVEKCLLLGRLSEQRGLLREQVSPTILRSPFLLPSEPQITSTRRSIPISSMLS